METTGPRGSNYPHPSPSYFEQVIGGFTKNFSRSMLSLKRPNATEHSRLLVAVVSLLDFCFYSRVESLRGPVTLPSDGSE